MKETGTTRLTFASGLLLMGVVLALVGGCTSAPPLKRFHYARIEMGVQARLVVYAPDQDTAERACAAAYERVAQLEQIMSDYRPDSELLQLCKRAGQGAIGVSPELFAVLEKAQEIAAQTEGGFDVTVGPAVQLWRKARKTRTLPTTQQIEEARSLVGYRMMHLDKRERTVALDRTGMRLDLGGIAKGYAGDEAIRVLRENGVKSALFEAGGDIVVSSPPPGEKGWKIEIESPAPGAPPRIALENAAISTSGDTVQFVEIAGKRYSHVIDPRTCMALTNHYAATVIAQDGLTSDPLSTAGCVIGPSGAEALARRHRATVEIRQVSPKP